MPDDRSLQDTVRNGFPGRVTSVKSRLPPYPAVAFWLAVALPVVYIPFLIIGIGEPRELALFVGMLGLHLATLYAGRSYRPG